MLRLAAAFSLRSTREIEPEVPHWRIATMRSRFDAAVADSLAIFVPALLLTMLAVSAFPQLDVRATVGGTFWLVGLLYLGGLEGRAGRVNGQTPGKRMHGIRTVRVREGAPVSRRRAWLRASLRAILIPVVPTAVLVQASIGADIPDHLGSSVVYAVWASFVLVAILTPTRRAPQDWLAGTAVVKDRIIGGPPTNPAITGEAAPTGLPMIPLALSRRTICVAHVGITLLTIAVYLSELVVPPPS